MKKGTTKKEAIKDLNEIIKKFTEKNDKVFVKTKIALDNYFNNK